MKTIKSIFFVLFLSCVNMAFAWDIFPDLSEDECVEYTNLFAQSTQDMSTIDSTYYYIGHSFMPSSQDSTIYMHLNLIFLQRNDGTGNFTEDEEYQTFWADCISGVNRRYANLINPDDDCYVNSGFISDVKLQFIPRYYYVRDEHAWNYKNGVLCPSSSWIMTHIDDSICANPNVTRGINVYFTEDSAAYVHYWVDNDTTTVDIEKRACSQFPDTIDFLRTSQIHIPDLFCKYWWMKYSVTESARYQELNRTWEYPVRGWLVESTARLLAHEIGHSLSLFHEDSECIDRIMNPNGGTTGNFISEFEMGKIYGALMSTNLRTFIPKKTYAGTKHLSGSQTYSSLRFYHSLVMDNASIITMQNEMFFPERASVTVHGELRLMNTNLHSIDGAWGGVRVKNGGVLRINGTTIDDYDIVVEPGGTLIVENNLTVAGKHHITLMPSSHICIFPGAKVTLLDNFSRIRVMENVLSSVDNCTCSSVLSLPIRGNGTIVDFTDDVYVQKKVYLSGDRYIGGKNIYVGSSVTDSISHGPVQIMGGSVMLDGSQVILESGTNIYEGAEFEIVPLKL